MRIFILLLLIFSFQLSAIARHLTPEERVLKQRILYELANNYIENAYHAGRLVIRWNKAELPLKIYIENSPNVPNYYDRAFYRSVAIWNKEFKNIVQVVFVENEKDADIAYKVIPRDSYIRETNENDSSILAYTAPVIKGGKLEKMNIFFYEKNADGSFLKPYEILNVAVHEFGHALGISGHSSNKNSIMYAMFDPKNQKLSSFISKEDRNTIYLLYIIAPDITNGNKTKEKGNIKGEILTGTVNERIDASILGLQNELKLMPNDCLTRVKLAFLYKEKGDEFNFLNYLKDATTYAKTKEDLYTINIGYATYYYEKKEKTKAKYYIKKALNFKKDGTALELQTYIERLK